MDTQRDMDEFMRATTTALANISNKLDIASNAVVFREGDKVEARYRGKTKYYPGRVLMTRLDGTYDIAYDDGETERNVCATFVRPAPTCTSGSPMGYRNIVDAIVELHNRITAMQYEDTDDAPPPARVLGYPMNVDEKGFLRRA